MIVETNTHSYFVPDTAAPDSDEGAIVFYDAVPTKSPSFGYWLVPGTEFPDGA